MRDEDPNKEDVNEDPPKGWSLMLYNKLWQLKMNYNELIKAEKFQ